MKILRYLMLSLMSGTAGYLVAENSLKKNIYKAQNMSDKHLALYLLMNQWVKIKQENKSIADYFETNNYKTIAIYGMSYVGERLYNELKDSNIKVKYAIDNAAVNCNIDCKIATMQDALNAVDAVIVTPIFYFDDIKEKLSKKVRCPIISIEDILHEI